MFNRFFYGLCCLVLLGYMGKSMWRTVFVSPQAVIEAPHAYEQLLDGKGVAVAVLDEGFDSSHTSLRDRLSPYRYNTNNKSRDVSETVIFENGHYAFESHGTHVTGIVSSVAPQVEIIPVKVGSFDGDQAFVKAIEIAALSSAKIVNISLRLSHTGRELSPNVRKALIQLAESGKLIVIAAGNE